MFTTFYRIIKYGFQNFSRNYLVSIATILVLLLAVIVFEGLLIFGVVGQKAIDLVQDKIDISIDFRETVPEDEMLKLKSSLEGLSEVKMVEYISKDEALERFRERHPEDSDIARALEEIGDNPLRASLNIKAYNPKDYSAIAAYLNNESLSPIIEMISYNQNQLVIDRLAKIVDIGRQAGFLLTILLATVASIVSFNTILLAIYSSREEIGIMRLVGASNAFIRGPYIVIGAIYGFLAAAAGVIITIPFVYFVSPFVSVLIPEMNLWGYFIGNLFTILGYNLAFAVTIGVVSSFVVVKRYLKG
ncbi:MAG: permease-like cell division protein FtsX [Candidatus Colwellbacteria bacterium]|jgi:cell division transport system permease protein|nr:ABC transporter permease [Candidatus Colwellbacteria bacterium]MCK9497557.1 ABC transporter permease [Candidatus Colwellbacteria bacterium]MDD3752593.1 permease-like cell division protein FtsX [Candidatus Colwellbacteria bacterium]MDD4818873.1 permease-like cell division protein FtsX [Candidatus Colwellbacteria bacterium]